ncbi:2-dehydropantoate 2-reductase [Nesterenkonia sp. E16_7]|nr:2-dehydropantoate 2-reductase [Nesterenkonia sp. E16_10]MBO0598616.1 2-dehydropantoate 2-reductase [Nesterenkonia sp. E16_7]
MRIAIVGAGAMGQLFGAKLTACDNDVVLIDTSEPTISALNQSGVTVQTPVSCIQTSVDAALAMDVKEPVELLMIFTKGCHTRAAVSSVRHLIRDYTIGLTLQNGLGNEEALLKLLGPGRTLVGVTDFPANRLGETLIGSADGHVTLGDTLPGQGISPAAETVATALSDAGLNASAHIEVRVPIWEKLIFNAVANTIGGATGLTVGATGTREPSRRLVDSVFEEAVSVARASGIAVNSDKVWSSLERAFVRHAAHKTSMTTDVEEGRRTEVDTIGGAIVAAGHQIGLATPVLSALCDVVRSRT